MIRILLWKDARREWRSKEALQAGLALVALFFLLDLYAFPTLEGQPRATAVILWTPLLYATVALVARGFATEADRGTLDLLRTTPAPLAEHGWARTLLHFGLALLVAAVTLLLAVLLFAVDSSAALVLTMFLGCLGFAIVGTLASAISSQARSRELLLPILAVPVLAPLLQAGIHATLQALTGASVVELSAPLLLMLGYDLIAFGAAWFLWPIVLEAE